MAANTQPKPRPYWYVDLKWIAGILACGTVAATLAVAGASNLTSQTTATRLLTTVITGAAASPTLGSADLQAVRSRATEVAGQVYNRGAIGLAEEITADPTKQAEVVKQSNLANLVTARTHSQLRPMLIILLILDTVLLAALIFFSHRAGRLVSPGIVLVISGWPGPLFLALSATPTNGQIETLPALLGIAGHGLAGPYLAAGGLGIILLLGAVVVKAISLLTQRAS